MRSLSLRLAEIDESLSQSVHAIKEHSKSVGFKGFPADCPVVFDIGSNDGSDSENYLKKGFCVVAVDANPQMINNTMKRFHRHHPQFENKIHFVPMGLGDTFGNFSFYLSYDTTRSGFDDRFANRKDKADPHTGQKMKRITVPTIQCEALWELIPNRAPYFMKIDIEERHYTCVEALQRLAHKQLPKYLSWEMHEWAKGTRFPALDTQLIEKMHALHYAKMKIASNLARAGGNAGVFSGKKMPEEVTDVETKSSDWVDTSAKLAKGIPCARCHHHDWWDYYMKLDGRISDSEPESISQPPANHAAPAPNYAYISMWYDPKIFEMNSTAKKSSAKPNLIVDQAVQDQVGKAEEADQDLSNPHGILSLAASLATSKYPLVVLTNAPHRLNGLDKNPRVIIHPITKEDVITHTCGAGIFGMMPGKLAHWKNAFQKVQIFKLTQYEKLMWMDADIHIQHNVDHLFDLDLHHGTAVYAQEDSLFVNRVCLGQKKLCSGVMLFKPSQTAYDLIQSKLHQPKEECPSDQQMISKVFSAKEGYGYETRFFPPETVTFHKCANEKTALVHYAFEEKDK